MQILTRNNEENLKLLNTENLECNVIRTTTDLSAAVENLKGLKLLQIEPVLDGPNPTEVNSILIYFELPDGRQRVIDIAPSEIEDRLSIHLYQN